MRFLRFLRMAPEGCDGANFATKWEFEKTFYGEPQSLARSRKGPVLYGWLTFVQVLVMCALVFVTGRARRWSKRPVWS
jgi:hypothetical protein